MSEKRLRTEIAFRCPNCGIATIGFLGKLINVSDMLRLKCECGKSSLDITKLRDGKISISSPCVYCKDNHKYILSEEILSRDEITKLSCPYSGMDIAFIGKEDDVSEELNRTSKELEQIMKAFEAEDLKDIQPQDMDESEVPPDPEIFDTINFLVKDLEETGSIHCPCGRGKYELRFTDDGIQVYCPDCGASYDFYAKSPFAAEEYMNIEKIELK